MAGNIFINYRRDESGHVAGRLHDSLAPTFGRNKLFMDVDNIPVGRDFEEYLKSQVAACDAMLAVIGPNWLTAKDEAGKRRLDSPDDFVAIEIGAALTRNIPVVPVLVDGARMPKASELPDSLKLLAKRQAIEVRHTNFSRDADALVKRLREAIGNDSPERQWRVRAAKVAAALAVLFLVVWIGYKVIHPMRIYLEDAYQAMQQLVEESKAERERKAEVVRADQERQEKAAAEAERQRQQTAALLAAANAERERQAEAKRKAEEAELQSKAAAEAEAKGNALFTIQRGMEGVLEGVYWAGSSPNRNRLLPNLSFEDCQEKCQAETCGVFTWRISTQTCYLYTRGSLKPNADFISGVRN